PFWITALGALLETNVQSPTSWAFLNFAFGAPGAPSASKARPNTVIAGIIRMLRRFMIFSLCSIDCSPARVSTCSRSDRRYKVVGELLLVIDGNVDGLLSLRIGACRRNRHGPAVCGHGNQTGLNRLTRSDAAETHSARI